MPPKGRFAGCEKGDGDSFLILGLACTIFPGDSETAHAIQAERHLLEWGADKSALVDRFDVRLLLDRWQDEDDDAGSYGDRMEAHLAALPDHDRLAEAEAEKERYCDMQDIQMALTGHSKEGGYRARAGRAVC